MHLFLLLIAAQPAASGTGEAEQAATEAMLQSRILPQIDPCLRPRGGDEIIVCGRRGANEIHRIPEILRDDSEPGRRIGGTGSAALDTGPITPCGIFQGERRCNKADAARFGYGGGRDPVTAVGRIISALSDDE